MIRTGTRFTAWHLTAAGNSAAAVLTLALVQGCAGSLAGMSAPTASPIAPPVAVTPAVRPATVAGSTERREQALGEANGQLAQQALTGGIDAYNRGDYNAAIRRLSAPEFANADRSVQIMAFKFSAFSYCVTKRQLQCRQQFSKALALDPGFTLVAGEKGHPQWGPAFELAKSNLRKLK